MADRPIADSIRDIPVNSAEIKVTQSGVSGQVSKPLGKGWSIGATGQWVKDAGYSVAAVLGWKGR